MNMTFRWPVTGISEETYRAVFVRIEDEGPDFEVTVHFDITDSGVAIKRISADVDQDTSGDLTSTQLRRIRIGQLRANIEKSLIADPTLLTPGSLWGKIVEAQGGTATDDELEYMSAARRAVESATETLTDRPKRGQGVDNQEWYGHIARVYLEFHAEHGQRTVKAMADYLDAAPNTVYWWVRKAREEEWLTKGRQGRAGAGPGPRLLRWLEEQEET